MSDRNETDERGMLPNHSEIIPKLSEEEKQSRKDKILLNECELILEIFQNNKTPGNDLTPAEFYMKLWPLIS